MDADHFAEFLTKAGFTVIRTPSSYWYEASRFVYLSFPPDTIIDPPPEELAALFRRKTILGVKFCTNQERGREGALYTIRDKGYDLPSLHIKHRPYVRKGLERCVVKEIDFTCLEQLGMPLNMDTLGRHGRKDPHFLKPLLWARFCAAGRTTQGAGVWGSFVEEQLAAYMVYFVAGGTCHLLYEMSQSSFNKQYPNHALQFVTIKEMISRSDINCVSGGFASFLDIEGLDRYKRYAGYKKEPVRYAVILRPAARRVLLSKAFATALGIAGRFSGTRDLAQRAKAIVEIARLG